MNNCKACSYMQPPQKECEGHPLVVVSYRYDGGEKKDVGWFIGRDLAYGITTIATRVTLRQGELNVLTTLTFSDSQLMAVAKINYEDIFQSYEFIPGGCDESM